MGMTERTNRMPLIRQLQESSSGSRNGMLLVANREFGYVISSVKALSVVAFASR